MRLEKGREPARGRRLPEGTPDQGLRRLTACGSRQGMDLLCDKYVLLRDVLNVDIADMGQQSSEITELMTELLRELEQRGVPEGTWLVDIARARQSLQEADSLLRRLEDAIIRSSSSAASPLDEL